MSLFSTLFNVGIARRVGIWALVQALPDEDALQVYLRAAYRGLAGIIIGSVLTGSAVAVGIAAAYNFMVKSGWDEGNALAATAGFTLLLIIACFALASRWFVQLASIKNDLSLGKNSHSLSGIVTEAVNNVTEGFVEGLTSKPAPAPPPSRRIRLIN